MKNCNLCWDCDGADNCKNCLMINNNYNPCEDCEEYKTCRLLTKN